MLALRLPSELETRLASLANNTGRSKSYYVKLAIENFLEIEEDYLLAVSQLEKKPSSASLKKVAKILTAKNPNKITRKAILDADLGITKKAFSVDDIFKMIK